MRSESKTRGLAVPGIVALAVFLLAAAPGARAQVMRYLGSITAINGDTLTVKTDAGDVHQVQVPSTAVLKRIAPGEKDLSKAEPLDYSGLAVGDRVLVTLDPNVTGSLPQAARIIAIKQADVAQKQEAETAAWNQGVHGLVKSVDATSGVIVVTTRMGPITKDVTVNTTAGDGAQALRARFGAFRRGTARAHRRHPPGDQLSARGTRNADGTAFAADGVITGSFRSIPGTVISIDTAASTITVKDLSTKKPVTVRVAADVELRRLDDNVATRMAAGLKGNPAGAAAAAHTAARGRRRR